MISRKQNRENKNKRWGGNNFILDNKGGAGNVRRGENKRRIYLSDILSWVKGNKKKVAIFFFVVVYLFFWMWYFGEKNVSVDDGVSKNLNVETSVEEDWSTNGDEEEEGFSRDSLGSFWLEVQTDNLQVKAPIHNGITSDVLERGIGRHVTTALPDEDGNMVISGHRWKFGKNPSYKVFEDLDELKNGDRVFVHYDGKVYEYEVYESGVVRDNEDGAREILKKTDDKILTLYTCTPKYTALKRLYYRAKFIKND